MLLILFMLLRLQSIAQQEPDWWKFLSKSQALMFRDAGRAYQLYDSVKSAAEKRGDEEQAIHANEFIGLLKLFQNDSVKAYQAFERSEAFLLARKDYIYLGDYESRKGIIIMNKLRFRQAEQLFFRSLAWFEKAGDKGRQSSLFSKLGMTYMYETRPTESVSAFTRGLKLAEETGDKHLILIGNINLGQMLLDMGDDTKPATYLLKAKNTAMELHDSVLLADANFYLTQFYQTKSDMATALSTGRNAMSFFDRHPEHPFYSSLCTLMGNIFIGINAPDSALYFAAKALDHSTATQDKTGIQTALSIAGKALLIKGNYKAAKAELEKGIAVSKDLGVTPTGVNLFRDLAECEFKLGSRDDAYKHLAAFVSMNDSLFRADAQKQVARVEASYQNEKKQHEIESLNREKALKDAELTARNEEIKQRNVQNLAMAAGLALTLVFCFFIWKSYRRKQKDNLLISEQRDQMEQQKKLVEDKNKEITDSITYAKRLQDAILPPVDQIKSLFKEAFILYRPKEIVAGDFYWVENLNGKLFFAVCDCTGHGVPGAMVSVVGHNGLNRCIMEFGLTDPGKILDRLSALVEETFSHSDLGVKDGMDISLCVYDPATGQLQWAGANNPLWLVRNDGFSEIKGDKQPIGKYELRKPFSTHTLNMKPSDCLYLFSDGYADQFGGEKGKKFKYAQLRELLISLKDESMEQQLQGLNEAFKSWKGQLDQVDDVCVIGIRI